MLFFVLQTMLKQIEWYITEHFEHPPPIGTRVQMFRKYVMWTVLCHVRSKEKQS